MYLICKLSMDNKNYANSFNPLQQGDQLLLQTPTYLVDPSLFRSLDAPMITSPGSKLLSERPAAADQNKKMVHREAERQRRQEMNHLYTSLRSHLPLEYIKGKRSLSDHMGESINYIKQLEKKNQELRHKRDKLKRLSNYSTYDHSVSEGVCGSYFVTVKRCYQGAEIVVCNSLKSEVLVPLSRILQLLSEEGFSAINCVSATVKERLIHTIQAEVRDAESCDEDICSLQQNLMKLIHSTW